MTALRDAIKVAVADADDGLLLTVFNDEGGHSVELPWPLVQALLDELTRRMQTRS